MSCNRHRYLVLSRGHSFGKLLNMGVSGHLVHEDFHRAVRPGREGEETLGSSKRPTAS